MTAQTPPTREIGLHELVEETDRGLFYDLSTLMDRRAALNALGFTTGSAGLMSPEEALTTAGSTSSGR